MAFCPNCGSPVQPGTTSCMKCGGPAVDAAPPPPQAPVYVTAPSPNSFQPGPYQPGFGAPLPDPSPMALIMAAGSWVICGPILSVPAVIKARSDMAGIREGRYNPNSMSMCQIAFWVGAINAGLYLLVFAFVAIIFIFTLFVASTAPSHRPRVTTSPVRVTTSTAPVRDFETIEREVERQMATRPETDRKLWRQVRDELRLMRKQKGAGPLPEARGLSELLRSSGTDAKLWAALTELERKAAEDSGRDAPSRVVPAEAPPEDPK